MARLAGEALSQAYRREQVRKAAALAAKIRRQFGGVLLDSPASQRNFLDLAVPEVLTANRAAAFDTLEFIRALREIESPGSEGLIIEAPAPTVEQVRTSLIVTGPAAYRRRVDRIQSPADTTRGKIDRDKARTTSSAGVMGAAIRHAQNGARDTVKQYATTSGEALGWYRMTAGDDRVCYFCAMLAGRVNYNDDSFDESDALFEGIGTAKVHDSCRCHLRPIYSKVLPDSVIEYRAHWSALSGGDDDPVTNFRRAWETRNGIRRPAA